MYNNPLVYGKSQIPNIVAAHPIWFNETATMRYYIRENGKVLHEDVRWFPFAWLSDPQVLTGVENLRWVELNGDLHYKYLVYTDAYDTFKEIKTRVNAANAERMNSGYMVTNLTHQWMIQSGNTLFKGMDFDDVHRVQLDIETYGKEHFAQPQNPDDPVIIITLTDNRGREAILHWHPTIRVPNDIHFKDEKQMLEGMVRVINGWDPDIIEWHNGFGYDGPYLVERARYNKVKLNIGRDGSAPWGYKSSFRAGENNRDFQIFAVNGRHVVDTMFAAMTYDVFKRELPGYGLKPVAKYFGFSAENRVMVEGDRIWWHWDNDPEPLLKYAIQDSIETERIAKELLGAPFYSTQIIPMSYEEVCRRGSGAKVESLFTREYLRQKNSLPHPQKGKQEAGGHTRIHVSGVVGPIVHADVESLYPSIMLNFPGCIPSSDELEIFRKLLTTLTEIRFDSKGKMRSAKTDELRRRWEAKQAAEKVLINSFYGYEGFPFGLFNDFAAADMVAEIGRTTIKSMAAYVADNGGTIIEVDTDGIYFVPPEDITTEEEERAFVTAMSETMPKGIKIGFDGRYKKMLSYKAKNYILEKYSGERDIKGSSFRSRATEPFGKEFIQRGFDAIMDGGIDELARLYHEYREKIMKHELPVEMLVKKTGLSKSIPDYLADLSKPRVYRSAHFEVAIILQERYGLPIGKGDKVQYFITGNSYDLKTKKKFELALPMREYEKGKANVAHYIARLDTMIEKFKPLFSGGDFRNIFMQQPSLFEVDLKTVESVTTKII